MSLADWLTLAAVVLTTGVIFNVVKRIEADVKAIRQWLDVDGEDGPR